MQRIIWAKETNHCPYEDLCRVAPRPVNAVDGKADEGEMVGGGRVHYAVCIDCEASRKGPSPDMFPCFADCTSGTSESCQQEELALWRQRGTDRSGQIGKHILTLESALLLRRKFGLCGAIRVFANVWRLLLET